MDGALEPETAREAIDLGLEVCKTGDWTGALALFRRALDLPGTGLKRYRDKPRLISDSERMAALYNIACCHSQLGESRNGLLALNEAMELGYADFPQIRRDPDLEALRQDERFEQLMARYERSRGGGFLGMNLQDFFKNKN